MFDDDVRVGGLLAGVLDKQRVLRLLQEIETGFSETTGPVRED
jgi:hypothetical protein